MREVEPEVVEVEYRVVNDATIEEPEIGVPPPENAAEPKQTVQPEPSRGKWYGLAAAIAACLALLAFWLWPTGDKPEQESLPAVADLPIAPPDLNAQFRADARRVFNSMSEPEQNEYRALMGRYGGVLPCYRFYQGTPKAALELTGASDIDDPQEFIELLGKTVGGRLPPWRRNATELGRMHAVALHDISNRPECLPTSFERRTGFARKF